MQIFGIQLHAAIRAFAILGIALFAGSIARAQAPAVPPQQKPPSSDDQFQNLIRSVKGVDLYRAYCASCHGLDAKGDGPVAPSLKATVPDLTLISQRNGGQFPVERVKRIIMGEHVLASHGSREMPVWGPIFHQIEDDVDRGYVRLDNLVKYLESIQAPPHK